MKLKKSWKRFWTLNRHHADGFTLVELIVVIAILAILAGVGSVGYSGYIKSANKNNDKVLVGNILRAVETAGNSHAFDLTVQEQVSANGLQVPVGMLILGKDKIIVDGSDKGYLYEMFPVMEQAQEGQPDPVNPNETVMREIMAAAYGKDYDSGTEMQLKSDAWTDSDISNFYADAEGLYGEVKSLSNILADDGWMFAINGVLGLAGKPTLDTYDSGIDAITGVAGNILAVYPTEDAFVAAWQAAGSGSNNTMDYAFGLDNKGMATYTAVRRAYNEALSSYVASQSAPATTHNTKEVINFNKDTGKYDLKEKTGGESVSTHVTAIKDCGIVVPNGNNKLAVSDTVVPKLFGETSDCDALIKKTTIDLGFLGQKTTYSVEDGSLENGTQFCETCKGYVEDYPTSSTAATDARAFYKTMATLGDPNSTIVTDAKELAKDDETAAWKMFDNYVTGFSGLYQEMEEITKEQSSCIVITIYYNDEMQNLTCEVSPSAANPRNE